MTKDNLSEIFHSIKKLMKKYEPPFESMSDYDSGYELISKKEVEIAGRKRKEIYFAGLIIRSKYVGFYYMPVYAKPEVKKVFKPGLLKLLKGKSCFHIKNLDAELIRQIDVALKLGFGIYKKNGWV